MAIFFLGLKKLVHDMEAKNDELELKLQDAEAAEFERVNMMEERHNEEIQKLKDDLTNDYYEQEQRSVSLPRWRAPSDPRPPEPTLVMFQNLPWWQRLPLLAMWPRPKLLCTSCGSN